MSYPDLGCFAECLTCELCEDTDPFDDDQPDLDFDWQDYDDVFGDDTDLDDWAPPPEEPSDPWEDLELPDPYPWVGPVGDGWGGGVGGSW